MMNSNHKKIVKMALLANFTAVAIVLNLIEAQLNFIPVPGAKLGLANLVTLIILYMYGIKEASILTLVRIVVVGLLSGRLLGPTFYMGTAGAISSLIVMGTLKQLKVFGMTLVSLIGSISHQIGQIVAGIFVIGATEVFYYLPIMLPIGVVSGIIIGLIAEKFMVTMKNNERTIE